MPSTPRDTPRRDSPRRHAHQPDEFRFTFEAGGQHYEVTDPLVHHPDYDPLFLAWRRPASGGPRRLVQLKQVSMLPGRDARRSAREEVRLATLLHHPKISRVYDFVVHKETPYVVLEHLPGCFLMTVLHAAALVDQRLSPAFAAYVAAEVADALEYAHHCDDEEGAPLRLVHRAVGPLRIRLGAEGRVKLCNFGAAYSELAGRLATPLDLLRGDPAYIAPELLRSFLAAHENPVAALSPRGLDGRADIFSLGLVLLEMLTSSYPLDPYGLVPNRPATRFPQGLRTERPTWIGLDVLFNRVLTFGPEEMERETERVTEPLRDIVRKALHPSPDLRYRTAADLRDDLRFYLRTSCVSGFGPLEMAAECKAILNEAAERKLLAAQTIERGVLPSAEGFLDHG
ncbi:protein kinase [Archangium violaceum]|uniref:protein kinase domain-containing protein n=1 Tax=Archangium violaceum TaxID=83451 RepID=UPI00194E8F60|nr:protein kinase [Archangium violaceum]QRO00722.1 protein kinase [Archangium violaceum]